MTRRSPKAIAICVAALLASLAIDLGSKQWAYDTLSRERPGTRPAVCQVDEHGNHLLQRVRSQPAEPIPHVVELEYAENCGAAFGLLDNAPSWLRNSIFGIAAIAAAIALMTMFVQGRGGPLFAWSVPFVVSGAIGNLVDRLRYGYVVDFIQLPWTRVRLSDGTFWEYPTFNVADIAIVIGVGLLVLDGSRKPKPEPKKTEDPKPSKGGKRRRKRPRDESAETEKSA